ncbi:unnamed protein product [Fraxinus pennsylvanica]|uniref:Uncharacterized protein n=1 Tax=Fraxinus pennsylvanica TaxID=56036 RepID=A0AAD1ZR22_9LAMI|nr:unnamed protein product [Fraxinus pennsylvanica]
MKRGLWWNDEEDDDTSSSDDSSTLDTDTEDNQASKSTKENTILSTKQKTCQVDSAKKKSKGVDFEALSQRGYKGGLSLLSIPPPKEPDQKQDWSWSSGKGTRAKEVEETYEDRLRTRDALADGELLKNVLTQKDKKNLSFQQKEKRKRDLGQTSRGKNYVEEEKRLLRDSGVYSGFDS